MILLKKLILFFLLICLPGLSRAQQMIYTSSVQLKYRMPYRSADGGIWSNGNELLREMAREVLREPRLVKVVVTSKIALTIEQIGDKYQLSIFFVHPVVSGDTLFRQFQIGNLLLPDRVNMKLRWANRLDTTSFSEVSVNDRSVNARDSLVCSFPVASFDPGIDTLMIREVQLFYDSLALDTFKKRLDLIHDYYAAGIMLDSLKQMAETIQLSDPGLLPANFIKAEECNKVIERIRVYDFPSTLLQDGFDPGRLEEKLADMNRLSRTVTFNFIDELKKAGPIPWQGGVDKFAGDFTARVLSYIRHSKLMDHLQNRIYQDFLGHCFDSSSFPPEEHVISMMFSKLYPGSGADTMARYVSGHIYRSYEDKSRNLINQNQYAEAFLMMENARLFAEKVHFSHAINKEDDLLSKAASGIYNSYTGIAEECIRNRNWGMADTYLTKANQYATGHAALIGSDSLYKAVFSGLFFLRNSDCDLLLDQMKYEEALHCYEEFEVKYTDSDLVFVKQKLEEKKEQAIAGLFRESAVRSEAALKKHQPDTAVYYFEAALQLRNRVKGNFAAFGMLDSLAPDIARIRYEKLFNSGAYALDRRQYTLALNQFNEAKSISDQYRIERDRSFDSLYRQTMKYYLIIQLSAAQKKIWANRFDSAYMALESTKSAGSAFGFADDPQFSEALLKFRQKISEQQCRNLDDSVKFQVLRADRSIALKNYLNASHCLQHALAFIAAGTECGFSDKTILDTLGKYNRAAAYQEKLLNARSQVAGGNYAVAIGELDENARDYQRYRLEGFGIIPENVFDFIRQRSNPYLTDQAVAYYLDKGNNREAIRFLHLLRAQGFPERSAASTQDQLAKMLARDDFQLKPGDTALILVDQYTSNDSWYDTFRASYLKEWNTLAKKTAIEK